MLDQAFAKATKTNSVPTTSHNRQKARTMTRLQATHDDNDEKQMQTQLKSCHPDH
jgi:hypothetical protein